jgi:hypothetical protein
VQAFDDDIRGTAGALPNRPILQVERILQHWWLRGWSRRPSDHSILEAPWPWMHKLVVSICAVALVFFIWIKG